MSKRFNRPKGPTKEDIEREAEREVARLRQQTGATPPGPGAGATPGVGGPGVGGAVGGFRTPLDDIAESARGRSAGRRESPSPVDPGYGPMASGPVGPGGYGAGPFGGGGPFVGGGPAARGAFGGRPPSIEVPEFEDPDDESASITELALRDHAARYGTNPEDLVIRSDPVMAEAMRDEAMRKFMERQQARQTQATVTKLDPSQTVLGRLAARRKAREEGREPEPEPEPTGGGLLGRLGQVEEDEEAGLSPLERRARAAARRREEMQQTSGQVFAMPTAGPEDTGSPELAAMAARLSAQAKPRRGASAEVADAGPLPARAPARRAPASKAPAKKATARSGAAAKKATAKKATARKAAARSAAAATRSPVKKAPARAATKKAPAEAGTRKAPARAATRAARATKAVKATKGAGRSPRSTTTTPSRARATKKRG
ncbi:MAG TPA: hypothetical protein VHF00_06380 [Acidimicrobiales bacterium]|nr:hypothetical protein [Acidimicrobiales bacterium]